MGISAKSKKTLVSFADISAVCRYFGSGRHWRTQKTAFFNDGQEVALWHLRCDEMEGLNLVHLHRKASSALRGSSVPAYP